MKAKEVLKIYNKYKRNQNQRNSPDYAGGGLFILRHADTSVNQPAAYHHPHIFLPDGKVPDRNHATDQRSLIGSDHQILFR